MVDAPRFVRDDYEDPYEYVVVLNKKVLQFSERSRGAMTINCVLPIA